MDEQGWNGVQFQVNDEVMAKNIKALPQINGVCGKVICKMTERYGVLFPKPFGEKSLKPANLQLVRHHGSVSQEPPAEKEQATEPAAQQQEKVTILDDPKQLQQICKTHPSLPKWNSKKSRHAGRQGVVISNDEDEGVYQIRFETGEECWFPREACVSLQKTAPQPEAPKSPKSPAISSIKVPNNFRCPVEVLCDPVDTEGIPGGLLRTDSVLSKDRKVLFDETNISVVTYDPSPCNTKEEKEQLRRQQQEAKLVEEQLSKKRKGVAGIIEEEASMRSTIDKEEHKRRRGMKSSYQNDKQELEILLQQCMLQVEMELGSEEDFKRLTIAEDQEAARRDLHDTLIIAEKDLKEKLKERELNQTLEEVVKPTVQPAYLNPSDIFLKQGWCYDSEREVTSPPKEAEPPKKAEVKPDSTIEKQKVVVDRVIEEQSKKDEYPAEPQINQEGLDQLLEQINNLTQIAKVLKESNGQLNTKMETLQKAYDMQANDVKVLEQNRERAETDLATMKAKAGREVMASKRSSDEKEWKEKHDKLKQQLGKGYESMQQLEARNLQLVKIVKLFEAFDRTAHKRAVHMVEGNIPHEDTPEEKLFKKVAALEKQNDSLDKKYRTAVKDLIQAEAKRDTYMERAETAYKQLQGMTNKGSSTNTETDESRKCVSATEARLAKDLQEERASNVELKRLLALFQQKLKNNHPSGASPEKHDNETKMDNLKKQLDQHQEKLIRVKEERDKLQKDLKKEKEKNKILRTSQQTAGKKK